MRVRSSTRRLWLASLASFAAVLAACTSRPGPSPTPSGGSPSSTATPVASGPRKIFVEIDQMAGTPALQLERDVRGQHVSLAEIYRQAGLELDVHTDQSDLPRAETLSLADLHAMMTAFRSLGVPAGAMRIHLLVVSRDRDDPNTLGIMFDFGEEDADGLPREGFAVFAGAHEGLGTEVADELLLTTAHELAHCFNLHHPDWEGQSFKSGSTIEGYSLTDTVRWELSPASRAHLRSDPEHEVWPGRDSLAFGLVTPDHLRRHKGSPLESFELTEKEQLRTARRGARAAPALRALRDRSRIRAIPERPLKLRLEAPKRSYVIGEPIVLTVALTNEGTRPEHVIPLLAPEHQFLAIELRRPGSEAFEAFRPGILMDTRGARTRVLQPGESVHAEAKIFFGSNGWTCKEPGAWVVRADFPIGGESGAAYDEADGRIQSPPLELEVVAPRTNPERRARDLIMGHQQGMYLLLGGGDHLKTASSRLRTLMTESGTAAQAPAVGLTLGKAALNPTIDPVTKLRSAPRLEEAKRFLQPTLEASLPPLAVARTHEALARELEKAGQSQNARQVRRNAIRELGGEKAAAEPVERMRRREQP